MDQKTIPFMQIRGGSSKGLYFLAADLPSDVTARDSLLLDALGRDSRQIDGLGGGDPLTSKVAIISPSTRSNADIDYLFAQVVVGENRVDTTPNCGNILAGVGPYAIESGLIQASNSQTSIRVHMVNSGKLCELVLQTPGGAISYSGDTRIDGVPGSSAPIICNYFDVAGSACGALLPTGNTKDVVEGIEVSCIDNGMPVVLIRAADMGISGTETPDALNANTTLTEKLHRLRLQIGPKMNLDNVESLAVPKMCLISVPQQGGVIHTRTFIPSKCHTAVGVLGAVSVATACILPGSVAEGLAEVTKSNPLSMRIEHPTGDMLVNLELKNDGDKLTRVTKAGLVRTARLLSRGELYLPC